MERSWFKRIFRQGDEREQELLTPEQKAEAFVQDVAKRMGHSYLDNMIEVSKILAGFGHWEISCKMVPMQNGDGFGLHVNVDGRFGLEEAYQLHNRMGPEDVGFLIGHDSAQYFIRSEQGECDITVGASDAVGRYGVNMVSDGLLLVSDLKIAQIKYSFTPTASAAISTTSF